MEPSDLIIASPDGNDRVKRKFLAEAGVNLYSSGATVFRPADLYRYGQNDNVRTALEGCNIYLICRRRRISVDPYSLRVSDGLLYGDFRLHGGGVDADVFNFESYSFSQKKHLLDQGGKPLRIAQAATRNSFGFEIIASTEHHGVGTIPAHALIANSNHKLGRHTDLEVLYVGLAYGKQGKRLAVDRLVDHTTLQRILAESTENNPCDEVLLLFFRFEHARSIISTAGDFSVEPTASSEQEEQHLQRLQELKLKRKTRIVLSEAALINHFKPKYNILHKESFQPYRMKRLKTLKDLFENDLSALIVEINTSNFGSKLFTAYRPAPKLSDALENLGIERLQSRTWLDERGISRGEAEQYIADMTHCHIARFPLYDKSERESFLHALPWN